MNEIIITSEDISIINPPLLAEELTTALGESIQVNSQETGGDLIEAVIRKTTGDDFDVGEQTTVASVISTHDHTQLSTSQQAEQALENRRNNAKAGIVALGADGIRVQGLPDLSETVAQIVEILDLDLE